MNECQAGNSPPDTGGVAAAPIKCRRSLLSAADGVVGIDEVFQSAFLEEVRFWTTINASPYRARASRPAAPLKEASRLLLDVASTPPMSGGEWHHPKFIHSFQNRAYKHWQQHPDGRTLYKRCQTSRESECPATAPSRTLR